MGIALQLPPEADEALLVIAYLRGSSRWGMSPSSTCAEWAQRLADQLGPQLPHDREEAEEVIGYLRDIVKWFRGVPYTWHDDIGGDVVPFSKRA